jgi:cell division septal protein FtsQ
VDTRREQGRRRLRLVAVVASVLAVGLLAFGVVHSPIFRVRHVRVFGVTEAGLGAVSSASGLDRERLMVDLDPPRLARSVETIPWVGTARVVRLWPATVEITVTHRVAVAEVALVAGDPGRGVALVDRTGRVLALRPGDPGGLPLLPSLQHPGSPGTWVPGTSGGAGGWRGDAAELLTTAAAVPASIADRVASIAVVGGQLQAQVGATVVLLGGTGSLTEKMTSLRTVVDEVDLASVARVDLRVPDRPALTPSAPGVRVSTTSEG